MSPAEVREQWAHRLSYFALTFTDAKQVYPRTGNKKYGGKTPPPTTEPTHNRIEDHMDLTNEQRNGSADLTEKQMKLITEQLKMLTSEEFTKRIDDLTRELKKSEKLSTKAINAAFEASAIAIGFGTVALCLHFATKPVLAV